MVKGHSHCSQAHFRLAPIDCNDHRRLTCCCSCRGLESDLNSGKLAAESVPAAFRQMCQAAILHWWAPNRQQALYTNSLLNYGNQQFAALAPSQSSHAGTGAGSAPADTFWLAAPVYDNLLAFNYPVSALPDGFQVGVQQPSGSMAITKEARHTCSFQSCQQSCNSVWPHS